MVAIMPEGYKSSEPERPIHQQWACEIVGITEKVVYVQARDMLKTSRDQQMGLDRSAFPPEESIEAGRQLTLTLFEQQEGLPDFDLRFVEPVLLTQEEVDQARDEAEVILAILDQSTGN